MPGAFDDVDLSAVALFPLPSVVLFPRAVLPLHIFEDRYRAMTADVLAGDRLVAMALLRPGWEKSYYGRPAIEPVVCVGQILTHEKLPDGKYNFLLQGLLRATVSRELPGAATPYRRAELKPLEEAPALEIDLEAERRRLVELFHAGPLGASGTGRQFRQIVKSHLPTCDVADLSAFTFLDDVGLKQSLLADADVRARVARTVDALAKLSRSMRPSAPPASPADAAPHGGAKDAGAKQGPADASSPPPFDPNLN
ncbi:MAG TPA: LON peptidase substrate-binding domain-containing protein [Tepidisphaeraceae bacterium]|nr:LON peptidase substrate-binding domain-containing protein [Tepidisphaeraceae bacterium]